MQTLKHKITKNIFRTYIGKRATDSQPKWVLARRKGFTAVNIILIQTTRRIELREAVTLRWIYGVLGIHNQGVSYYAAG